MALAAEIEVRRQNIRTESYPMSIGEFSNLYRDREMEIRPEFQRLFRWSLDQQSRLVESILLGIPLPSVFVATRADGVWEVIDGLQRLSTIFGFMGLLRSPDNGDVLPPTKLVATKYLPSLEGAMYDSDDPKANCFDPATRIAFKRAKLDVQILQPESHDSFKFELFDRLNSGGEPTSGQEVRTAQVLMVAPAFHHWLEELRNDENFQLCLPLTTRQLNEQYDLELVMRFLVLRHTPRQELIGFADFDSLLTEQALAFAGVDGVGTATPLDLPTAADDFRRTFRLISGFGIDAFRRFDSAKDRFLGGFSVSAFEVVAPGVAAHLEEWEAAGDAAGTLRARCAGVWADNTFRQKSGAGVRASQRIPVTAALGETLMQP